VRPFDTQTLIENFNSKIIVCEPFYAGTTNFLITQALINQYYQITNIGVTREFNYAYGSKENHDRVNLLDTESIKEKINNVISH
jgi:transketolase